MPEPVLSQRTLNRTLLARQLLLEPVSMDPLAAAEHLVGLQAQLPTSPYIALHARLARFDPATLSQAMEDRRAVRIVLMRGTIHLVSADDALLLRPVIQPVLDRELLARPDVGAGHRRRRARAGPRAGAHARRGEAALAGGAADRAWPQVSRETRAASPTRCAISCRRSRSRPAGCGAARARRS